MSRRGLVVGASGQVGSAVAEAFADFDLTQTQRAPSTGDRLALDLGDPGAVAAALERVRPHVVVIAGAWTWVDGAEDNPDDCLATNVAGPAQIARWCGAHDATVVYYSTDHVFDGTRNPHRVDDPARPLNTYARSKVDGEAQIRALAARHIIVRTAWVYGPDTREKNFAIRLVRALQAGERVRVPADQWGTPTYAPDLAQLTRALVDGELYGTFHAVGPDFVSRTDLSERVCAVFGLDPALLEAVPTAALGQRADRPLEVRLDMAITDRLFPGALRGVDEGLAALARWFSATQPVSNAGAHAPTDAGTKPPAPSATDDE